MGRMVQGSGRGETTLKDSCKPYLKRGFDWLNLDQGSGGLILKKLINLRVPLDVGNSLTSLATVSLRSRAVFHGVCDD